MFKQEGDSDCRLKYIVFVITAVAAVITVLAVGAYRVYSFFVKGTKCHKKVDSLKEDTEQHSLGK